MHTVTTHRNFGSVDDYARMMRAYGLGNAEPDLATISYVGAVVEHASLSDAERIAHIRNILAAAEQVRGEIRQAGR